MSSVESHYKDPSCPYPGDDNAVIYELTPYVESAGIHDPLTKVFISYDCGFSDHVCIVDLRYTKAIEGINVHCVHLHTNTAD